MTLTFTVTENVYYAQGSDKANDGLTVTNEVGITTSTQLSIRT